jgi:glycosyltransferase involved in cell wall biosynthesis
MIRCLLVGPSQEGGEGVYVKEVFENPPDGVQYSLTQKFHHGSQGANCNVGQEILLNRLVHPFLRYTFGFRVLSVSSEIDIVHVHSHPTRVDGKARAPVVMSAGSSHYIYVRDYEKWSERKIRRRYRLARAIYRTLRIYDELLHSEHVTRIYTFSNWARDIYLRHGIPRNKVDVIYPGFAVPVLARRAKEPGRTRFLFVGREFLRKGGPLVVAAFARLRRQRKDVSLGLVTRDVDLVLRSEGVEVFPFASRERLYDTIYPAADVFVMPTEAEGWGFTVAEAMSFGLPVISTSISAIPEIVDDGVTGTLIAAGDGEALFAAMTRFASSADLCREMGARGRERFVERFSRDVFRGRLGEFYDEALRS